MTKNPSALSDAAVKRLNWGCGRRVAPGWINSDRSRGHGIDVSCDIRDGLPLESGSIDYIASVHALQEIPYPDLIPVLQELRRLLKPGGVLRLVLPDLDKAIQAYLRNDRDYFLIPDADAESTAGKLIVQVLWYGHSRTLFTFDFARELLLKPGYRDISQCSIQETKGRFAGIVELDNREQESFFVEAVK